MGFINPQTSLGGTILQWTTHGDCFMAIEPYQSHVSMNQCGSAAALFFDVKPHSRCQCFGTGFCFCTCTVGKTSLRVDVPSVLSAELDSKRVASLKKRIQSKLKTYCSTSEKKIRKKQVIRSAPFPTSKNSGRSHCPRRCCLSHTVWLATLPSHITPYIHR